MSTSSTRFCGAIESPLRDDSCAKIKNVHPHHKTAARRTSSSYGHDCDDIVGVMPKAPNRTVKKNRQAMIKYVIFTSSCAARVPVFTASVQRRPHRCNQPQDLREPATACREHRSWRRSGRAFAVAASRTARCRPLTSVESPRRSRVRIRDAQVAALSSARHLAPNRGSRAHVGAADARPTGPRNARIPKHPNPKNSPEKEPGLEAMDCEQATRLASWAANPS